MDKNCPYKQALKLHIVPSKYSPTEEILYKREDFKRINFKILSHKYTMMTRLSGCCFKLQKHDEEEEEEIPVQLHYKSEWAEKLLQELLKNK